MEDDRKRNPEYLDYVRRHFCCLCGEHPPSTPHHYRMSGSCGIGKKPPDYMTLPLCNNCHVKIHARGPTLEERHTMASKGLEILSRWVCNREEWWLRVSGYETEEGVVCEDEEQF